MTIGSPIETVNTFTFVTVWFLLFSIVTVKLNILNPTENVGPVDHIYFSSFHPLKHPKPPRSREGVGVPLNNDSLTRATI